MAYEISIDRTVQFHKCLASLLEPHEPQLHAALRSANAAMAEQGMTLGGLKPLEVALSALLLSGKDADRLRDLAHTLHGLIEKVLERLMRHPDRLAHWFPEHRRMLPYLTATKGAASWQVVSRYDVAITATGQLKVLELDTGCPGAFLISEAVSRETQRALAQLPDRATPTVDRMGTVTPAGLIDGLLDLERRSGITPAVIGILTDENELTFELDLLASGLRDRGRDAVIADARQLTYRDGKLRLEGHELSLTWNKFRISTPHSPNHCWQHGFQQRYAAFLAAQQDGAVVSVNNLVGMTVAEDKALLGLLREAPLEMEMSGEEQRFVSDYVAWTARLEEGQVTWQDRTIDLMPYVRKHPELFVIKPANEGRGFGVVVGKWASREQWQRACTVDPNLPRIVQEYVEPVSFPVVYERNGKMEVQDMFLTLGLGVVSGSYQGIVARISTNPVTNVARDGYGQAVFCVA